MRIQRSQPLTLLLDSALYTFLTKHARDNGRTIQDVGCDLLWMAAESVFPFVPERPVRRVDPRNLEILTTISMLEDSPTTAELLGVLGWSPACLHSRIKILVGSGLMFSLGIRSNAPGRPPTIWGLTEEGKRVVEEAGGA